MGSTIDQMSQIEIKSDNWLYINKKECKISTQQHHVKMH